MKAKPSPRHDDAGVPANPARRRVIRIASAGITAGIALPCMRVAAQTPPSAGTASAAPPQAGDLLVDTNADGPPSPVKPSDLPLHKPVLVYPQGPDAKAPRTDSRLNEVLLIRFEESELTGAAKDRAAGGVLGFSAICTHQGCEVKTWLSQQKVLSCYCHGSMFQPLDGGAVVGGPAPRPLPMLPLKLDNGRIAAAGPLSAPPGATVG